MMLVDTIVSTEYEWVLIEEQKVLVGAFDFNVSVLVPLGIGKYVDGNFVLKLLLFEIGVHT